MRVLVASAGLQLLSLKRVRVGGYVLPRDVPLGGYRYVTMAQQHYFVNPHVCWGVQLMFTALV